MKNLFEKYKDFCRNNSDKDDWNHTLARLSIK